MLRQGIRAQTGGFQEGKQDSGKDIGTQAWNQDSYREIKLRQEIRLKQEVRLRLGINQDSGRELGLRQGFR
jgi:hypothetical protein